jgi:hypothetical protein
MRHLGSKCHINVYVTPWYYDIFLVFQKCHIKEVRMYMCFTINSKSGLSLNVISQSNYKKVLNFNCYAMWFLNLNCIIYKYLYIQY